LTSRICKKCGRPLTEQDDEYCPHCRAKRAGCLQKVLAGITGLGVALVTIGLVIWRLIKWIVDNRSKS